MAATRGASPTARSTNVGLELSIAPVNTAKKTKATGTATQLGDAASPSSHSPTASDAAPPTRSQRGSDCHRALTFQLY